MKIFFQKKLEALKQFVGFIKRQERKTIIDFLFCFLLIVAGNIVAFLKGLPYPMFILGSILGAIFVLAIVVASSFGTPQDEARTSGIIWGLLCGAGLSLLVWVIIPFIIFACIAIVAIVWGIFLG